MKFLGIFVLIMILGTSAYYIPSLPEYPELKGFFEKYENGICTEEEIKQLQEQEQNCMEMADFFNTTALIEGERNSTEWCTHLENVLKCWDNYTECYNHEQIKELNTTIIVWLGEQNFGMPEKCPIYLESINDGNSLDWIIILVVFFYVTGIFSAVQNYRKNNIRGS